MDLLYQGICATCGVQVPRGEPAYRDALTGNLYCVDHPPVVHMHEDGRQVIPVSSLSHVDNQLSGRLVDHEVGRCLDSLSGKGVIALHDWRMPGSTTTIDHVAVAPTGVYLIETEHWEGTKVRGRLLRSVFKPGLSDQLVGGLDRTKLVFKTACRLEMMRTVLLALPEARLVAGRPMHVVVGAQWGVLPSPIEIDGVWVGRPQQMEKVISGPGRVDPETIQRIANWLRFTQMPAGRHSP